MTRINLLAAERPTKKKKGGGGGGGGGGMPSAPGAVQAYLILALFAGGAALVCVVAFLMLSSQIKDLDQKIAAAEQRQRELQVIKQQVDALERKRATFQRKVDLIERLKAEQSAPVHMLDEVSKALPDFVWLTGMDSVGPPGTSTVKFAGQSSGLTPVADFISALQRSGWFPNVDLVSSTEKDNIVTFAVQGAFRSPEVAAKEAQAAARKPLPGSTAAGAKPGAAAPPARR
jgi:type IV pilus assembly protein PilN